MSSVSETSLLCGPNGNMDRSSIFYFAFTFGPIYSFENLADMDDASSGRRVFS